MRFLALEVKKHKKIIKKSQKSLDNKNQKCII